MMYLFFFGLLFNFFQPNVENLLLEQSNLYINEIQSEKHLSEYSWALIDIYQASCLFSNTVQRHINRSSTTLPKKLLASTTCGEKVPSIQFFELIHENQLYGLATYILINSIDTDHFNFVLNAVSDSDKHDIPEQYLSLFEKISNNDSINLSEFPEENADLILNAIIYKRVGDTFLLPDDLNQIIDKYKFGTPDDRNILRALQLSNASFILFSENRYTEFSSLHQELISDRFFPNSPLKVRFTNALAYTHYTMGRYDYSLQLHRNIIEPLVAYFNRKDDLDQSKLDQGVNLYSLGKFAEARDIFEDLYYDPTSNISEGQINNNLGVSYFRLGEKNKYIRYLLNALEKAEGDTSYTTTLGILYNLYFYYSSIGDHKSAFEYRELAREIAVSNNDIYQIANIHAITGMYYWRTENDVEKALQQLQLASKEFNPERNFFDYFRSQISISDIYIELDSLEQATSVLISLNELASETANSNAFIESTMGLLNISLLQGDLATAKRHLETIELYSLDNLDFNTLVKFNTLSTDYQFQSGDQRLAYQSLRPVIEQVLDRARTSIDTQTGFWVQEDEYIDAFNSLLSILISMGNEQEAVQLLDEIKTINDAALYNSPILRANRLTEEELARDQLLNSQIMNLRESFLYALDSNTRLTIKNEIDQLSAEREEILNKIREDGVIEKTPIWMIQQQLESSQQILHFTEVGDFMYISYISNNSIRLRKLDFESAEKALFTDVADQIALSKTNLIDLFEIYDFLGIENDVDFNKTSVIVIPDNYLYRIPLEILPLDSPESPTSYGSTTYLIEKFNIEYYASLQEYNSDNRQRLANFSTELSAFAISDFSNFKGPYLPTLPFASQEVRTISNKLYAFDVKNIYMEKEATKSAFLNEVSNAKIVHIATHSEVSEQDPLFSTIYLNDENTLNDINALYAYELFDQRLNNELIMLNSCSSGSGDYLQGSGIMGITRALRYAGAKSMALNLWAVNDKVAYEFASVFYESLNEGNSKSEAMRDAKLHLLQNGNANPHFWGAFMLTGDPSPIIKRPDNAGLVFPFLLVMIGMLSVYLRKNYTI